MKPMDYFDVIFVIENTASCGGYLNEIKTKFIHPALEYFCNGLLQEESTNLFGIVLFKTSQTAPLANCCTSYGPFNAQKFLKKVDELELTGGRGEQCANLVEGLATALVCFHDLEKRRENELTTQKHCVLISNSPPYTMPVTECYEYEGKNLEQLTGLFVEKNINLSIISPRKIPILYEIFEKSGGDLGLTAKNYSKDPRHLVLLKGFSLKELIHDKRPESPPASQPVAAPPQMPAVPQPTPQQQQAPPQAQQNQPSGPQMMSGANEQQQQQQQQPQMVQMPPMGMQNQGMRPGIRPNQPMMPQAAQQQSQQPNVMQNMGNPPQFSGPMGNFAGQQRPMAPNQPRQQFMPGMMNVGGNMMNPNQPSALISQLNQPPSVGSANPNMANPMRMPMVNQQQNQPMMQNQPQNPQMMVNQQQNPGMMQNQQQNPNMQMQNQQMMAANQQKQGMMQNQQNPNMAMMQNQPQNSQMMNQNQQNPGMMQNQGQNQGMQNPQMMPPRERIWVGILEWNDKQNQQNQVRQVPCEIYASLSKETNEPEIRGDTWPNRLIMQLMPKTVISNVGGQMLRDARVVQFQWGNSEAFESLSKVMANGFAGCVHFTGHQQCDVKILILLYMQDKKSYYGFVPNDQSGYVEKLRRVIQQSKITQFGQNPGQVPQQPQQQPQQAQPQQQQMQGQVPRPMMGMGQPNMPGNQNMMQGDQGMMFNQQQQQRMTRPMMAPNNNLRHLLQQQQTQFRPQMGGPQQGGAPGQMQQGRPGSFDGIDPSQFDMNFQMN